MYDFTLTDTSNLINIGDNPAKFIIGDGDMGVYINDKEQFSNAIISEFRKRNFKVDGINAEFSFTDKNFDRIELSKITGDDFNLTFNRGILESALIPEMELNIYSDGSLSFYKYVGSNWDLDKNKFYSNKVDSKLKNESKFYLRYNKGRKFNGVTSLEEITHKKYERLSKMRDLHIESEFNFNNLYYDGGHNPLLVFDDDLGREYTPEEGECEYYYIDDIMYHVYTWVYDNVYLKIKNTPIPEFLKDEKLFKKPDAIPLNYDNNCFYQTRIYDIDNKAKILYPNYRVLPYSQRLLDSHESKYFNIVNDGFIWLKQFNELDTPKAYIHSIDILKVTLKNANEVYVIDNTESSIKRSKSMVHINDYKGGYKNEIIVVRRIIRSDELSVVKNKNYVENTESAYDSLEFFNI